MSTNQLLEHVTIVVKGIECGSWLPQEIKNISDRITLLSNSEVADLESVFFELNGWLKGNTGQFALCDATAKLQRKLKEDGRAKRIEAHMAIVGSPGKAGIDYVIWGY